MIVVGVIKMLTHMVHPDFMLRTLCLQTHHRIYHNLENWTFDENEVTCDTCLYYLKIKNRNKLYDW